MDENNKLSLAQHLEELRRNIIICLLAILTGTVVSYFWFLDVISSIIMAPIKVLHAELVLLSITEGLLTQFKLAFFGGILVSSPVLFWQTIKFVLPALYRHERKSFLLILTSSVILFTSGIYFAYKYALGLGLKVLLIDFSGGLTPLISVGKYISFVSAFLLPFGIVCQIPLLIFFLSRKGLVTSGFLISKRRHLLLLAFVIAAILSPGPDIISQVILAVPIVILYELSIIIAALSEGKKD